MKLSFLLICVGGLISATMIRPSEWKDRRSFSQIYQDAKAGRLRTSLYRKVATIASVGLIVVGMYLALTWR